MSSTSSSVPTDPIVAVEIADTSLPPSGCPLPAGGRAALAACAIGLLAGFALAARLDPDPRGYGTHQRLGLPPCSLRVWLDLPCPSCGGTTAFAEFVRGRWGRAIAANPAAFGLAIVSVVLIPWSLYSAAIGCTWRVSRPDLLLVWVLGTFLSVSFLQWLAVLLARAL
jgi:hypothetical protein